MMIAMRRVIFAIGFLLVMMTPMWALADDTAAVDGRFNAYGKTVALPPGGTGVYWVLLVPLTVIAVGGLFKDARRSHLD
ncbi:MAG: hypothetical protein ABSF29_10800 [Tepidisphaeraceae bacterium]|jgi:hypothetical protein